MIIRKIEEKDIQKLAKLMKSVYNEAPWNDEWTEESAEEAIKCLLAFPNFLALSLVMGMMRLEPSWEILDHIQSKGLII